MAATGNDSSQTQQRTRSGADLVTLMVAALAAVVAAVVTSKLWQNGTLISTAMTPVIVALVKEYVQRPVEKVGELARAPIVAVRSGSTTAMPVGARRRSAPPEAERHGRIIDAPREPDPQEYEPLETRLPPGEDPYDTPYRVYRQKPSAPGRGRPWWKVGLVTGLAAFLVAVVVITVPELVGGGSVAGAGKTTLFSHKKSSASKDQSKDTTTSTTKSDSNGTSTPSSNGQQQQSTTTTPSSATPQSTTPQSTTPQSTTPSAAPQQSTTPAPSSGGGSSP
jgi:hypothetical protein